MENNWDGSELPWILSKSGHSDFDVCLTDSYGSNVCHFSNWNTRHADAKFVSECSILRKQINCEPHELLERFKAMKKDMEDMKRKYSRGIEIHQGIVSNKNRSNIQKNRSSYQLTILESVVSDLSEALQTKTVVE